MYFFFNYNQPELILLKGIHSSVNIKYFYTYKYIWDDFEL